MSTSIADKANASIGKAGWSNEPFANLLRSELVARCKSNPSYSLRAFAKCIEVSASVLSQVLSGKRFFSDKRKLKILDSLGVDPETKRQVMQGVDQRSSRTPHSFFSLELDEFEFISDWHNLALLCLLKIDLKERSPEFLAKRLGLQVELIRDSLSRMTRLKLIEEDEHGHFRSAHESVRVLNTKSSKGSIQFNVQIMQKAIAAVREQKFEERVSTSTFIQTNRDDIAKVREELKVFKRYIASKYSKTSGVEDVYCLSSQFFKLTK